MASPNNQVVHIFRGKVPCGKQIAKIKRQRKRRTSRVSPARIYQVRPTSSTSAPSDQLGNSLDISSFKSLKKSDSSSLDSGITMETLESNTPGMLDEGPFPAEGTIWRTHVADYTNTDWQYEISSEAES